MRGSGFGARSIANSRALYGIQEGLGFPFNMHGLCIYARPCASTLRRVCFHQCQQFRESPSLARDLGARSGLRRGDQASGLGFGAHLNEDSRGMARAVSTRSLLATHLRSGFLRFERAHKPQRERGKKVSRPFHRPSPSPHPIVRHRCSLSFTISLALALALTF